MQSAEVQTKTKEAATRTKECVGNLICRPYCTNSKFTNKFNCCREMDFVSKNEEAAAMTVDGGDGDCDGDGDCGLLGLWQQQLPQ